MTHRAIVSSYFQKRLTLHCVLCLDAFFPSRGKEAVLYESYLVDPASSHMLVSKIKPCMSKYKHPYTAKLRTAHYISDYLFDGTLLHG